MNQERVFKVLLGPHVSEKATVLADSKKQFVFKVATDATKLEIKKAVESLFDVKVAAVNTLNVQGKTKRSSRSGQAQRLEEGVYRSSAGPGSRFLRQC